jgi:hypothetical protein
VGQQRGKERKRERERERERGKERERKREREIESACKRCSSKNGKERFGTYIQVVLSKIAL